MTRVALVGGGIAGLGAARQLGRIPGVEITVFEAGARLGGRVSTVERGPLRFDDGAQFLRTDTARTRTVVLDELPRGDLADIRRDVRPFNRANEIGEGDPAQNAEPKWVYRTGLATLASLLVAGSTARFQLGCPVSSVSRTAEGWVVSTPRGDAPGFDALLVTCPPAAALQVLERSALHAEITRALTGAFADARHRSIISVAFEPMKQVEPPGNAYALVNTDRKHDVSWLAFEEAKSGYVPDGRQVLLAQMSHAWSAGRLADPDRATVQDAVHAVASLLGQQTSPRWTHVTRWPEALPDVLVSPDATAAGSELGLFFAGDAFTGGRVHLALESGLDAADRIVDYLAAMK